MASHATFCSFDHTVCIGQGDEDGWLATAGVLRWGMKTRRGFVYGTLSVHPGTGGEGFYPT